MATKTVKPTVTIHYVSGRTQRFEVMVKAEGHATWWRFEKLLKSSDHLLMDLGDRLLVIPIRMIEAIEIAPGPKRMPAEAVFAARELREGTARGAGHGRGETFVTDIEIPRLPE